MSEKLKTLNIKGKEYSPVNVRLEYFRKQKKYEKYGIETDIVSLNDNRVVMKTSITNDTGRVVATGLAYEDNKGNVNSTSFIENCDTSSIGRALANLGIGIDGSIASADEVGFACYGDYLPALDACISLNISKEEILGVLRDLYKSKKKG